MTTWGERGAWEEGGGVGGVETEVEGGAGGEVSREVDAGSSTSRDGGRRREVGRGSIFILKHQPGTVRLYSYGLILNLVARSVRLNILSVEPSFATHKNKMMIPLVKRFLHFESDQN